jgi:hypothetical protein
MAVLRLLAAAFMSGLDRGPIAVLEAPDLLDRINDDEDQEDEQ